jgi:hypothetical protein
MNESDAPPFLAHPLNGSCSSELDAAVIARRDERI